MFLTKKQDNFPVPGILPDPQAKTNKLAGAAQGFAMTGTKGCLDGALVMMSERIIQCVAKY